MATHSSILAWRIPWTEEPGGLQSTGSRRVRHDWVTSLHFKIKVILVILSLVKPCISYIVIPTGFFLNAWNVLIIKSRILQGFDIRLIGLQFPEMYPFFIFVFDVCCPWLFESVTHWCPTLCDPTDCVARQAPLSMELSRQEYWSGLPFPSPGDLSNPGIEPGSPALQADALSSEPPGLLISPLLEGT